MSVPAHCPGSAARRRGLLAAAILALATAVTYLGTFSCPFVFDDVLAITENETIRRLTSLDEVLWGAQPGGVTTSGRPLVNFTLAVNYAVSGLDVWSYHALNLLIHIGAGLFLFGLVRRTLLLTAIERFGTARSHGAGLPGAAGSPEPTLVAFGAAALWLLHPLQTESVTYIVQRAESLAGLFVLMTLYGFARASEGSPSVARHWLAVSIAACAAGMATKEVVVSTPLLVLVYHRTFVAGSFASAWRQRRSFYLSLAATWILLAVLVLLTAGRGGSAGFGAGMSVWHYALTQCEAILGYLARVIWPASLVFDYGTATVTDIAEVVPQLVLLAAALACTFLALRRRSGLGFLGLWFFAFLAPSSSIIPVVTQTAAEHRMYLPLAALSVACAWVIVCFAGKSARWILAGLVVALAIATAARNQDYRSELSIWSDTVMKKPGNARAHNNLGQALFRAGRLADAEVSYRHALKLQPAYPEGHYNLGVALAARGDHEAAIASYERALRAEPAYPEAENNLANALVAMGRHDEALRHYEAALRINPRFAEAENNVATALLSLGRASEAVVRARRALAVNSDYPEARYTLGNALAASGNMEAALTEFRRATQRRPGYGAAHVNAGNALLALNRPEQALAEYESAIAADPGILEARVNAGLVLVDLGRFGEAVEHLEAVARTRSAAPHAIRALGFALAQLGRRDEAIRQYEKYLTHMPQDAEVRDELRRVNAQRP